MSRGRVRPLPSSGAVPTFTVAGSLLVIIVLLGLSPTLNPIALLTGSGFEVEVPDVRELTQTRALLALERTHLHGDVDFAYSAAVPRGLVISQRPRAGAALRRGSDVAVTVSRGPSRVPVPSVVLLPEAQAVRDLERLGLMADVERLHDELIPEGSVVRQSPAAETILSGGDEVAIVVSLGPLVRTVPRLVGVAVEGAMFDLGKAGLALGEVRQADDAAVPVGAVIATEPPAGTTLERDTPVDVIVSAGPPPVAVPDLVGGTQSNAADQLTRLGLVAGEVSSFGLPGDPDAGRILAQSPPAGSMLRRGQVVTLTVRRAAPTTTTSTTLPPAPPAPGGG